MDHAKFINSGRNFKKISAIKGAMMNHVTCFVKVNEWHHNIMM